VGRGIVNVEMCFLQTLAMISLWVAQAEQSLLQKGILLVPEGKSDVLQAMAITDTSNAVFTPSERSGSSLIVGEVTPSITIVGVIFSDGSPLPFGGVASPSLPVLLAFAVLLQTFLLLAEVLVVIDNDHGGILFNEGLEWLEECSKSCEEGKDRSKHNAMKGTGM